MRVLAILVTVIFGLPALAQNQIDTPFTASGLSTDEIRFLQGAMSYRGKYNGLLDGKWGQGSQGALEAMTRSMPGPGGATWRKTAKIAEDFEKTIEKGRWQPRLHTPTGFSVQLPTAEMSRSGGGDDRTFASKGDTLKLRTVVTSIAAAGQLHAKAVANSPGLKADYALVRPDRLVTSTTLNSGRTVYIRSDARDGGFATVAVEWKPDRAPQARLIIASLRTGAQNPLRIPPGGTLARMIRQLEARPQVAVQTGQGRLVGTGFYVNNTDLLTAASVMSACEAPELADGSKLNRVRLLAGKEVVLLTSAARSDRWLEIGFPEVPEQGATLSVARYAGTGASPVLQRAGASVVMLLQPVAGTLRLLVAAASGEDQLGAPVFDANNRVAAIVTSRPSQADTAILGQMSLAAPATRLAAALRRSAILFADAGASGAISVAPAPAPDMAAVVPIFCR